MQSKAKQTAEEIKAGRYPSWPFVQLTTAQVKKLSLLQKRNIRDFTSLGDARW